MGGNGNQARREETDSLDKKVAVPASSPLICYARFHLLSKIMWTQTHTEEIGRHWLRADGAIVKKTKNYLMRNPSKNPRLFLAYAPNDDFPLSVERKNSRRGFRVSRCFKTPESAMKIVDKEFPLISPRSA